MAGRPRKPTSLLLVQGTARGHRLKSQGRNLEPAADKALGDAPAYMPLDAVQEWGERKSVAPWLQASDAPVVMGYCVQFAVIKRMIAEGRDEEITPSQWHGFRAFCQSLGFDPPNRARMQMPAEKKAVNKFAALGS